ncbi:MAG: prepilin-type N-terminal cleavage/methylation domain-containing protein [Candidatus Omnitrophica bacterium]|nr:prepilin-type N-terminal cleavage/methylation domain-containing protein [Candidatus Omnitrophota bacterium]
MISVIGRNRGFTLIEIMISIAILSLGLILVLQGLTQCVGILRIAEDNLGASLLADDKIAEMEIAVKQDKDAFLKDASGESQSGNIEFKWQVRLTPDMEYEDLYAVLATVRWNEGKRSGASIFNTYLMIPHG